MELRNLITFIHVAELGSFSKTAETLGYSQSTISFQIKQLEEELDCLLFDRINHTVRLTERGHQLISYAHQIRTRTSSRTASAAKTNTAAIFTSSPPTPSAKNSSTPTTSIFTAGIPPSR